MIKQSVVYGFPDSHIDHHHHHHIVHYIGLHLKVVDKYKSMSHSIGVAQLLLSTTLMTLMGQNISFDC